MSMYAPIVNFQLGNACALPSKRSPEGSEPRELSEPSGPDDDEAEEEEAEERDIRGRADWSDKLFKPQDELKVSSLDE
jgi:hypothetical protein